MAGEEAGHMKKYLLMDNIERNPSWPLIYRGFNVGSDLDSKPVINGVNIHCDMLFFNP